MNVPPNLCSKISRGSAVDSLGSTFHTSCLQRSRLLIPALAQGMLMLDRGDGSLEDIDKSLELGAGHPMGPLTLAVR